MFTYIITQAFYSCQTRYREYNYRKGECFRNWN